MIRYLSRGGQLNVAACYNSSRVSMVAADVLAPNGRQDISNHHADVTPWLFMPRDAYPLEWRYMSGVLASQITEN